MYIEEPKFELNQTVYHITPESEAGVIVNILYDFVLKKFSYNVTIGWEREVWCGEEELSETKIFI